MTGELARLDAERLADLKDRWGSAAAMPVLTPPPMTVDDLAADMTDPDGTPWTGWTVEYMGETRRGPEEED
jgi:hypothetical protein